MTKPTTYHVQTPAIDQLTERYGSTLSGLSRIDKLDLLASIADTLYSAAAKAEEPSSETFAAFNTIRDESDSTLLGLCEALIAQLRAN